MILAKTKAKTNKTSILQASLMIVTYDHQNSFIVKAIHSSNSIPCLSQQKFKFDLDIFGSEFDTY